MKWTLMAAAFGAALSMFSTAPVVANDLMDTVRARGNARAGGPTNGHDAWILDRYGKLSGTFDSGYVGLTTTQKSKARTALRKLRKSY